MKKQRSGRRTTANTAAVETGNSMSADYADYADYAESRKQKAEGRRQKVEGRREK